MLLEQRAGTRPLGALLAQDVILLRRQLRAPFGIGLFDLEFLRSLCRRSAQPAEGGKAEQSGDRCEQDTAIDHDGLRLKRKMNRSLSNTGCGSESYTDWDQNFSHSCEMSRRGQLIPMAVELTKLLRPRLAGRPAAADVRDAGGPVADGAVAAWFRPGGWPRL